MRGIVAICIMWACLGALGAKNLHVSATGSTQEEAKNNALEELSQSIAVQVRTHNEIKQVRIEDTTTEEVTSHITLESNTQFINPKITYQKLSRDSYEASVLVDNPKDYHDATQKLSLEINALGIGVDTPITQRDLKERIYKLENILTQYKLYQAYAQVLIAMGEEVRHFPTQSMAYFASKYASIDPDMFEQRIAPKEVSTSRIYRYKHGYSSSAGLLAAIRANDADGVYSALKDGVNPDIMDEFGNTALILGITNAEIVTLLLEFGANPDEVNNEGYTPLIFANDPSISAKTCASIQALLAHKANPNHTIEINHTKIVPIMHFYEKHTPGFKGEFWERQGQVYCDKSEVVKLFVKAGANVNERDDHARGILTLAAMISVSIPATAKISAISSTSSTPLTEMSSSRPRKYSQAARGRRSQRKALSHGRHRAPRRFRNHCGGGLRRPAQGEHRTGILRRSGTGEWNGQAYFFRLYG